MAHQPFLFLLNSSRYFKKIIWAAVAAQTFFFHGTVRLAANAFWTFSSLKLPENVEFNSIVIFISFLVIQKRNILKRKDGTLVLFFHCFGILPSKSTKNTPKKYCHFNISLLKKFLKQTVNALVTAELITVLDIFHAVIFSMKGSCSENYHLQFTFCLAWTLEIMHFFKVSNLLLYIILLKYSYLTCNVLQ